MDESVERFREQAGEWELELSSEQVESMIRYACLLVDYKKANVTGVRTYDEALLDHVLDSLSCLLVETLRSADSLVDVGSGGGLPGLPLKIALPGAAVTLVEATGKKALFLREAVGELGVSGVEVLAARAEEAGRNERQRGRYRAATVRAVAALPVVAEYCLPFLERGGVVVAMKGGLRDAELNAGEAAVARLGGRIAEVLEVPRLDEQRSGRRLVVFEKVEESPEEFPRKAGRPEKRPLG